MDALLTFLADALRAAVNEGHVDELFLRPLFVPELRIAWDHGLAHSWLRYRGVAQGTAFLRFQAVAA